MARRKRPLTPWIPKCFRCLAVMKFARPFCFLRWRKLPHGVNFASLTCSTNISSPPVFIADRIFICNSQAVFLLTFRSLESCIDEIPFFADKINVMAINHFWSGSLEFSKTVPTVTLNEFLQEWQLCLSFLLLVFWLPQYGQVGVFFQRIDSRCFTHFCWVFNSWLM